MDKEYLCIYHGNCADGFGAAYCVKNALPECEFHAGVYQNDPPDVTGKNVILVDFSYSPETLKAMASKAHSIVIVDHHKTAMEAFENSGLPAWMVTDMSGWTGVICWDRYQQNLYQDYCENLGASGYCGIYTYFDMNRSGAGMAWDFFFPNKERPALINHIEDRDLWRFELDGTREIQAALFSYPYDFEVWKLLIDGVSVEHLKKDGEAIERKHHKDVAELTKVVTREMVIGGHSVPVANLPYTLTSDAGHLLCGDSYPFAGCYWDTPEGRVFSLRSREGGADVGEIAKSYGGGGHKNASGFRVSFEKLQELGLF